LDYKNIPECLQDAWAVQNHKADKEATEAFLSTPTGMTQLHAIKEGYFQYMIAKILGVP